MKNNFIVKELAFTNEGWEVIKAIPFNTMCDGLRYLKYHEKDKDENLVECVNVDEEQFIIYENVEANELMD